MLLKNVAGLDVNAIERALFSLMFSVMLTCAFRDGDTGIGIRHRTDAGSLFNLRRL